MRALALALALACSASGAKAEAILACQFPTMPDAVLDFSALPPSFSLGARPAQPMTSGLGWGSAHTATIDGYFISLVGKTGPQGKTTAEMTITKDGTALASEQGQCITIHGPENPTPLSFAAAAPVEALAETVQPAPIKDLGKWRVSQDKSAFDDTSSVFISIDSNADVRGQFGSPGPASMHLRCQENTTSAFLVLNDLFLADIQGYGKVDYRIDTGKAASARMEASTDNKALGLWSGTRAIPFIKQLMDGEEIVLRATPFNDSPVEFSFTLKGLQDAIPPLRAACKW